MSSWPGPRLGAQSDLVEFGLVVATFAVAAESTAVNVISPVAGVTVAGQFQVILYHCLVA